MIQESGGHGLHTDLREKANKRRAAKHREVVNRLIWIDSLRATVIDTVYIDIGYKLMDDIPIIHSYSYFWTWYWDQKTCRLWTLRNKIFANLTTAWGHGNPERHLWWVGSSKMLNNFHRWSPSICIIDVIYVGKNDKIVASAFLSSFFVRFVPAWTHMPWLTAEVISQESESEKVIHREYEYQQTTIFVWWF